MRAALAVLAVLAACHHEHCCRPAAVVVPSGIVSTDVGPIAGTLAADGAGAYLGVPFAAPPVGPLRWMPPAPATPWTTPRDATKIGHACIQFEVDKLPVPDEDCLTLQVWTPPPDRSSVPLPVMVWIPGGAFVEGGGNFGLYDGAKLAAREHVIVVSLNYRLGAFGFVALPGVPHPSLGLLDQRAALQWVQRNIAAFGGDPHVVTIFGESAGAWSVCAHLAMPGSRGLFARAIMESGSCADPLYFDRATAEMQGRALMTALGCTDVACMRGKSAVAVLNALPRRRGYILPAGAWWGPIVDEPDLPAQPLELLRAGKGANVPLLLGWNRDEGTLHTIRFDKVEPGELAQFVDEAWGPRAAATMIASYHGATPKDTLTELITDGVFACEARRIARVLTAQHVPVFAYEWTHPLDNPQAHGLGATHSVELWFVFGNTDMGIGLSAAEQALADRTMDAWGAFARRGDPTTSALPWPRYDAATDALVVLDTEPSVATHVKAAICDAWDQVAAR